MLVLTKFLHGLNGVSFWRRDLCLGADFQLQMDVSDSLDFGIYFRGRWCAGKWPESWQEAGLTRDLNFLELFPIIGALWLWAGEWANSVVCLTELVLQRLRLQGWSFGMQPLMVSSKRNAYMQTTCCGVCLLQILLFSHQVMSDSS